MSERSSVQNPMLRYAAAIGWEHVAPIDALRLRGGDSGIFFADVLAAQLRRLNPGIVDDERAADIMRRLTLLHPTIEGNRDAFLWFQGKQSVFVPDENRERNVRLIDFDNPDNNIFHVTDEWRHAGARFPNRADVIFLINGLPVALAETKKASLADGLEQGVDQVRRYHRETPEMLVLPQVFEVTHLVGFFYGVTWSTNRKNLFNWKDEQPGDFEHKVKAFFDRLRFLQVLHDYIVFLSKDDELSKVILRQHQTRAVEKVTARVHDPTRRRGLIWHTQGSGKTYTMITIASKLLRDIPDAEKPTVLMLIDRNELETQLVQNIAGYGLGTVKVATGKDDVRDILASDYRGLVVSMIHKFDDIPANINTRASIVVLVDEAHRTTGGDLGTYLMAALPNATYIGFTGTPIDNLSRGKGTFKVFGPDDPQGYLDKYSIAESIEDGTTVQLNYALAPSDLRVDRETLDRQFLSLAEAEGVSDIMELNAILDRATELKEMMKAPERVAKIAAFVAQHFQENVEPLGFKAFLVAVDREACALYKTALDQYLPPEYAQVVYSPGTNDSFELKQYYLDPAAEKDIRNNFRKKKGQPPKILIVTEKLLTGFDAPILYCMYLDKPMRDHVLLQAIARVNRPYEDDEGLTKPYGFVLDFVGIFERLESALAFDSDVVASVIQNVDVLKNLFLTQMREAGAPYLAQVQEAALPNPGQEATLPDPAQIREATLPYLPLARGWDDKAKERAIDYFADRMRRDAFVTFFRRLQNLYDILSPDAFLRPYIDPYQALAELYGLIRNAYSDRPYVDKELTAKTKDLLRGQTASGALELPGAIYSLGAQELAALKASSTTDPVKILNLRKVLAVTVDRESGAKPFLLSIGERAEALADLYEDRHLTTQQALAEFEKLAQEYLDADAQRQRLGVDENTFAIYSTLKLVIATLTAEQATAINAIFVCFPDYQWNGQQESALRSELYKALRPLAGAKFIDATNTLLKLQRI